LISCVLTTGFNNINFKQIKSRINGYMCCKIVKFRVCFLLTCYRADRYWAQRLLFLCGRTVCLPPSLLDKIDSEVY